MKFERHKDPKETLKIGLLKACQDLVKDKHISILDETETRDILILNNSEIWKYYPYPHTAASFIKSAAVNRSVQCHICIGTMNNRFYVQKNTGHSILPLDLSLKDKLEKGSSGTLEELYAILEPLGEKTLYIKRSMS